MTAITQISSPSSCSENSAAAAVAAKLHADYHSDAIGQLALADLLTSYAYDRHVRSRRLRYRNRRDLLQSHFGPETQLGAMGFRLQGISAGLHALLTLPSEGEGEQEVCARAEASGVAIGSLGEHWHTAGPHPQGIIVGFGTPSDLVYPAALKALAGVLAQS